MALSKMMSEYMKLKENYKDYILLYRLGDFYEMFYDDAILASKELEITLTGRDCGMKERAPMCGVPYHSVDSYIARLVQKGYKVSICEQIKAPDSNEVVGREVVKIITPGTVSEPQMLDETKNSYIVGICADDRSDGEVALCFADISTGEVIISELYKKIDLKIINELAKYTPREAYVNKNIDDILFLANFLKEPSNNCIITKGDNQSFEYETASEKINLHMGQHPESVGFTSPLTICAFGGLLDYLYKTQFCDLSHMKKITFLGRDNFMDIDYFTWRNLEITETLRAKSKKGSLLGVLDKTQTAMGARLLRRYLEKPLLGIAPILKRQNSVYDFHEKNMERSELRELLVNVRDIERLISKVVYDTINPRDMRALAESFSKLPEIKSSLYKFSAPLILELANQIDILADIYKIIDDAIVENPPIVIRDGNIIKDDYNEDIQTLKTFLKDNKAIITKLEADEKEKTGIKTLKVGYNKVFGYYIEVSKSFVNQVPQDYIRKQTLTNGERYITADLKEIESKLLTANDEVIKLETEIYNRIKIVVSGALNRIKSTADAIATADVLSTFAEVSRKNEYCCPQISKDGIIEIKAGRHPVVEKNLKDELFIANDTYLNDGNNQIALITGPNMAGKSTYMRQVAIIVLMAQIGCFVPASFAQIGIVDKIFTRVGASDDLTSGQSTFMVEMNEVAYILNNATKNSLLIFDEIGRGTSTFDGMSIAQAVIEYAAKKVKAKTLFATHYHELVKLDEVFSCVKNYNIAAKKRENDIVFLRKIVEGGTDDSYGIEVAKLAGVPKDVIKRAEAILKDLEKNKIPIELPISKNNNNNDNEEISLTSNLSNEILEKLKKMDVTVMTPIEAMNELFTLSKEAKENV